MEKAAKTNKPKKNESDNLFNPVRINRNWSNSNTFSLPIPPGTCQKSNLYSCGAVTAAPLSDAPAGGTGAVC